MITLEETKRDPLLRLLPATLPQQKIERLPSFITAADVREMIHYLRRRPAGVIVTEELDRPRKRLFEDRKVDAYEFLGITTSEGQTLKLSTQGWKLSRALEQDAQVFRSLLRCHGPYVNALDWISQQNIDMVTSTELSSFWNGPSVAAFTFADQEAIRSSAVSFFNLCQAAGLGTMTLGKRGHITRLFVDREELGRFLEAKSDFDFTSGRPIRDGGRYEFEGSEIVDDISDPSNSLTVLVKCDVPKISELLHRTLEMAGLPSLSIDAVAGKSPTARVELASRESCALIIVLGEESFVKQSDESACIRDRVLIELGAAHVHYEQRVIILAARKITRCETLKDLIWYEIDKEHPNWELGLELIQTLRKFREHVQPQQFESQ